jgi:hypothetical protein
MASLSITEAWNETGELLRREGRLLYPIAFLLTALPGAIMQALMPERPLGTLPEPGPWLIMLPVSILATLIGTIALTVLALRAGTSIGEALQAGLRRLLPLLGALLLVGLAGAVLMIPLTALIGGLAMTGGSTPELNGALMFVPLLFLIIATIFWVRLMLMTSVAAAEDAGPLRIISRSWALTRGHFWRLLGFALLFGILVLVTLLAVSAVGGILIYFVAGEPHPGSLAMALVLLLSAVFQAAISCVFTILLARMYAQLSGHVDSDIFA